MGRSMKGGGQDEGARGRGAKSRAFYPILAAAFPVLSLFSSNQDELPMTVLWVPLGASVLLGIVVMLGIGRLRRFDAIRPILATVIIVAIYTFGPWSEVLNRLARLTWGIPGSLWPMKLWLVSVAGPLGILLWLRRGRREIRTRLRRSEKIVASLVGLLIALAPVIALMQLGLIPPLRRAGDGLTLTVWLVSMGGLAALTLRWPRVPAAAHSILNNIAVCMVALPLISIVRFQIQLREEGREAPTEEFLNGEIAVDVDPELLPDIIHIVYDAYTGPAALEREFGLDMEPFLAQLESRGFSIARQATSSYYLTPLSLGSTFNYEHVPVHELSGGQRGTDLQRVQQYFWGNRLFRRLKALGYTTYSLESGYIISDMLPVDVSMRGRFIPLRRFVGLLLDLTPARPIHSLAGGQEDEPHGDTFKTVRTSVELLPKLASRPSPKFILAHFPTPHLPIVLDENGERFTADPQFLAMTRSRMIEPPASYERYYKGYYRQQIMGLNRLTLRMLDELIPKLARPTVIIIQGDHGSELDYILDHPTIGRMKERYSTLNAIRFAGSRPDAFDERASLVNTYRIILNEYFGQQLPLLEDRFYFHEGPESRLVLFDVSGEIAGTTEPKVLGQGSQGPEGRSAEEATASPPQPRKREPSPVE